MRSLLQSVTAAVLLAGGGLQAQGNRPVVHVIGTGGTIGSAGDYWGGNATRVPIADLVKVPGIDSVATMESEQLYQTGSVNIGPARWLEMSRRITALFRSRPELAGIIVTHGTDTMEETAYFLDLTVGDRRPVIVTGSMRPSDMAGADGPANLMNSARVAASSAALGRGTMVLMDDKLFAARAVTKTNSTRVETFQAPERGPIAITDADGLFFHVPSPNRSSAQFDISDVQELPRVDIAYAYAGADSAAIDAFVAAGAKGIVVAGVGRGGASASQGRALDRASKKGVVVVSTTRTGAGRVGDGSDASVGGGDLNAQKARILLMLALTRTTKVADIKKIFAENQ
jgi:L-asparaginase type II